MVKRMKMAHDDDGRPPRENPFAAPVSRLEFYAFILVALGAKALPAFAPGAVAALSALWP